ncbi:T9SS type A sorting domain-containing protein [Flavobacterium sp. 2]|uniref:T9SS type A sorting domain-containing protein n=1 Tax=Flavobacterium sp. 2 TaxID=308053 RepID=UPI003CE7AF33
MKRKLLVLLSVLFISSFTYAQYTTIPDVNFENRLIQLKIDSGLPDGKVLTANIKTVQTLDVGFSKISNLNGIEDFTELQVLRCSSNYLTTLDVTKNTKLTVVDCSFNKLTYLNISNLLLLNGLTCSDNELTSLDISSNPILNGIRCGNNNLISLNLKNGYNSKFNDYFIDFKNNPHLDCIQVDNITYSNSKWSTYKDAAAVFSNSCGPKYTTITDSNFENKLINLGIDKDGLNGKVLTSDIVSVTTLDISNTAIKDLTGLEDFLGLTTLNVSGNSLSKLDLTWQKKLKILDCSNCQLTALDLSKNINLETLNFSNNKITTTNLWNNGLLITVKANGNLFTTLDIDGLKVLQTIDVSDNQLTSLNLSQNVLLTQLKCSNNKITALNTSKNINLNSIYFGSNKLTTFDISLNPLLTEISCENNLLASLNLKNGNNTNFKTYDFRNNPALACIEVDNAAYSTSNWSSKKDAATTYNVYCGPFTTIPDSAFEDKLIVLGIDKDGKNGKIVTAFISNLTSLDLSNSSITDLTGIKDFTALTTLTVSGNQLVNLDLSNNKNLKVLNCSNNQLASLDVSKNTLLTDFYCNNNLLKTLNIKNGKNTKLVNFDFRNNPNLTCIEVDVVSYATTNWSAKKDPATTFEIFCGDYTLIPDYAFETSLINKGIDIDGRNGKVLTSSISGLTKLDVSNTSISNLKGIQDFKSLINLSCYNSKITALDLSQNTQLETLNCSGNLLTTLNVTNNKKLLSLNFNTNSLANIDLSQNILLQSLDCSSNLIAVLDISQNTALTSLKCNTNKLTALDISKNTSISVLNCYGNKITNLDLTLQKGLTNINCSSNALTSLDVSKNLSITDFDCSGNKITNLDLSKNTSLKNINCEVNSLRSLNLKNGNNALFNQVRVSVNYEMYCIQVDNEDDFNTRFKNYKDQQAVYSENCDQVTLIPDPAFEDVLIANYIDIDGKNGKVQTFRIKQRPSLYVSAYKVKDLTGIQDFKGLQSLDCSYNELTALNLSQNLLLTSLKCNSNAIANLDLSKNTLLTEVDCQKNKITAIDISNSKALTRINCSDNQLTNLNVANGNNKNMAKLYNESDFRKNPNLTCIYVDNVDYSNSNWFGLKDPTASYSRSCGLYADIPDANLEAKLILLGIDKDGLNGKILKSDAEAVTSLDISGSAITNVSTLEYFTALKTLNLSSNDITNLNLNKNVLLTSLDCSNTKITSLDISKNKALTSLNTGNTKLTYVSLKNGNNNKIQSLNLKNNTGLTCIEVDDLNYANSNWSAYKDPSANFSVSCGIYTAIPDDNFEYKLIALKIDTDGKNNRVLTSNISNLTLLDVKSSQISDLTGIQDFKALKTLYFDENVVTNIDLSKNTELTILSCSKNNLTSLNLSSQKKLSNLDCSNNKLTALNLESNTVLDRLSCSYNELTQLDVTKNAILGGIACDGNHLTSIDLTKNPLFVGISASGNELKSLDLSQCPKVNQIRVSNNKITSDALIIPKTAPLKVVDLNYNLLTNLDISNYSLLEDLECYGNKLITLKASNNASLTELNCNDNELVSLDITKNKSLKTLHCANNKLTTIDFYQDAALYWVYCQNNNLTNLDFSPLLGMNALYAYNNKLQSLSLAYQFDDGATTGDITNNPSLTCIKVNNMTYAPNWPLKKDTTAQYSTDCISITTIADPKFEEYLINAGIDKDGKNGQVLNVNLANITTLDISNLGITDLKGIEGFKALQKLSCNGNSISNINLSSNLMLSYLNCSNNPLTTLNVSNNSLLKELYCDGSVTVTKKSNEGPSKLTSLDVSSNTLLTKLSCANNQLKSLDLSKNINLTEVNCSSNNLTNLNLNNRNNSKLINLNFKSNASLTCIKVDNESYSTLNWSAAKDISAKYSATCGTLTVEESIFSSITIYPNPSSGTVNIDNIDLEKITVYDTLGKLVKTATFKTGITNHSIDLNELPRGVYYIFLETNGTHIVKKIVLQ